MAIFLLSSLISEDSESYSKSSTVYITLIDINIWLKNSLIHRRRRNS